MNQITLPPSPNWYLSNIFSCGKDGIVAWGSCDSIVVAKRQEYKYKSLDYSIIRKAHNDKVNSIKFSPEYGEHGKNLLVSGGQDNIIKIWDIDTMTLKTSQQYKNSKDKIICVDWSKNNVNLVACVNQDGKILSWDIKYSKCNYIDIGKLSATCIALCPHKEYLAAIGSKNGLIYIVNLVRSEGIVYKLRGHDVEITCLSWCPTPVNIFDDKAPQDLLLASGAKDKTIFIWRAGGDGRCETQIDLPSAIKDTHQHRTIVNSNLQFLTLCWLEPRLLVSSSTYGEVLSLELTNLTLKYSSQWKLIHGNHIRGIFSISCLSQIYSNEEKDWQVPLKYDVWSISQDRQIICCNVEKDNNTVTIDQCIHTQGSFVYCLDACNVDSSRIAYGAGDGLLRIWNLSEPHKNSVDITTLWQKINAKVTSVAWHPQEENVLAFATSEGRVGIFDTHSPTKVPTLYRQFHKHTIYTIRWGPKSGKKPGNTMFTCDDKHLVEYIFDKPNADPKIISTNCSEFTWSPDKNYLAIGSNNGIINITNNKHINIGQPIDELKKPIQCLTWHPTCTATDKHQSPYKNYLAVASTASSILILDLTNMIENFEKKNIDHVPNINSFCAPYIVAAKLCGHVDKVHCLAWNPHLSGQLISASADNTAQIWDIKKKEILATYTGHLGPIYCCMWSPLNPYMVITGSKDFTLRIWKISEQKPMIPKPQIEFKKFNKSIQNKTSDIDSTEQNIIQHLEQIKDKKSKSKKNKLFFKYRCLVSDKEIFRKECLKLVNQIKNLKDESNNNIPTIFGEDDDDIKSILNLEITSFIDNNDNSSAAMINLLNNNLKEQLEMSAKELKLNDFLVSLAPSLSIKTWQEMCEAYATQLIMDGKPSKAVAYLLCINKVSQAIDVFLDAKMHREAYVLARCRLEKQDAKIKMILENWATFESKWGGFEEAAKCYIALGELTKAAKLLSRRFDIITLETGADLAQIDNDKELTETIANQAVTQSLIEMQFDKAKYLIDKFPVVNYRLLQLKVLIILKESLDRVNHHFLEEWFAGKSTYGLNVILNNISKEVEFASDYKKIADSNYPIPDSSDKLWFFVSHEMALSSIVENEKKKTQHIVKALDLIYQFEIQVSKKSDEWKISRLLNFISLLEAKSPIVNLIGKNKDIVAQKSLKAYLCLALLGYLVDKLQNDESKQNTDIHLARRMIEATLNDALDQDAVKYWTLEGDIDQLKKELVANSQASDADNNDEKPKLTSEEILKQLDEIRDKKTKFIEERIAIPNPLIVYCKAIEVCNLLTDESVKKKLSKTINEIWTQAVS